ncbi:putative transposase [Martelella radicis]|uniref:Putative transposase n=1 Tax=Martelella radicis TaxID=1397476 RepID=A0A7W6KNJ5_9HYPH|nr:putative transposase [Martelella radicis]
MRFAFIARHRRPASWLCKVLEVSRSGFHAWLTRPASHREIDDARPVRGIDKSFKASDRTYGGAASGAMCLRKVCRAASTGLNG